MSRRKNFNNRNNVPMKIIPLYFASVAFLILRNINVQRVPTKPGPPIWTLIWTPFWTPIWTP